MPPSRSRRWSKRPYVTRRFFHFSLRCLFGWCDGDLFLRRTSRTGRESTIYRVFDELTFFDSPPTSTKPSRRTSEENELISIFALDSGIWLSFHRYLMEAQLSIIGTLSKKILAADPNECSLLFSETRKDSLDSVSWKPAFDSAGMSFGDHRFIVPS